MKHVHGNEKEYKLRIGANVRKWRNLKSIKQKQLAMSLNLSEAAVSNIENDITNINMRQLEDIAKAIDISVVELLNDPEESYQHLQQVQKTETPQVYDKELLSAMISSLEKKDAQLEKMMQNVLTTMAAVINKNKIRS